MALILAINPGNSHSPTLARLARELKGYELVGAESCAVAITAIRQRKPDLVLLPEKTPRGEAELLVVLNRLPGGVPTLKLPPVASADPAAIAKEIRTILAGEITQQPARTTTQPIVVSPHLVAAAKALVTWVHARRASWATPVPVFEPLFEPAFAPEPYEPRERHEPHEPTNQRTDEPTNLTNQRTDEPDEPGSSSADLFGDRAKPAKKSWLPRVAIFAGVVGIAAAGVFVWPSISGSGARSAPSTEAPSEPAPVPSTVPSDAPAPGEPAQQVAQPTDAPPAPVENESGWIAVSAPFEVTITNGDEALTLDDRGRAVLAPGKYRLRFDNTEAGYSETRTVEVRPAATATVNIRPQTPIAVTSNEPAEVLVDGARAGDTPYKGAVPFGARTITVRTPSGSERQFPLEATMKPVQLDVDFSRP